jgi:hypothetical protein
MITEQQLKADCTPEIIKKMVELADMGKYYEAFGEDIIYGLTCHGFIFPLLIHRAVEGWNKIDNQSFYIYMGYRYISKNYPEYDIRYAFKNYQPQFLTHCECACLHCLIEVLG